MNSKPLVLVALGITLASTGSADAQEPQKLPLALAMDAVSGTIHACEAKGYSVAVAIVDPDGVIQIEARGDGSPIHSQRFAYRKAYTVMSMGPVFGVETSGDLIAKITNVNPVGLANIAGGSTDLLFLPGGALVKSGNETIAAIGVSGAPQSTEDEACALVGTSMITARLSH